MAAAAVARPADRDVWPPIVRFRSGGSRVHRAVKASAIAGARVPLVNVNHVALAVAVHAQVVADAVTATEPEPPVSATF